MYLRECNNFYLLAVYILQAGVNYLNRKKKLKVRVCGFNAYRTRIFSIIHEPVRKSFSFIFDYVPNLIRLKVTLYWNSHTDHRLLQFVGINICRKNETKMFCFDFEYQLRNSGEQILMIYG